MCRGILFQYFVFVVSKYLCNNFLTYVKESCSQTRYTYCKGGVVMYNQLRNENVIIELEGLVKAVENFDEELNSYLQFCKERMLSLSGNN